MQNIPVQAIAAMATLIAALITSAISFVNLTLNKEQKTSEFRQAWIDGLRDELSKFLAAARAFARAVEVVNVHGAEYKEKTTLRMTDEKVSELRYQAAEMLCKIQLRLNPSETEHQELLRLLRRAISEQNTMLRERSGIDETMAAIELATTYAQPVLKAEWERVKKGELPFRIARNWIAPIIGLLSFFFVALLYFVKFTACNL